MDKDKLATMLQRIERLNKEAQALQEESCDFPALSKNADRILAALRMMDANLPARLVKEGGD